MLGRLPFYGEPEVLPDRSQASSLSAEELVVAYHERTKHHFHRFAASVGYMDWATQPDPFRRYEGASLVRLPFPEMGQALPYWQLYVADMRSCLPLAPSTTVPASTTTHRRNTVSSVEPMLTRRSGLP